ncbi:MAG: ribosome biogenesis GTPase Der [Oscillospiraceae bacterium]|jgi:GTP-binding protein|nr:ribosome biogenesis GTPase Der [Oscillospiraceae bacterium]
MAKPLVAVVGRPNVGKSTFFNRVAGSRIAIVEDTPGVTRDRIYADAQWLNRNFTLIDTGGIDPSAQDVLFSQMREQAQIAIDTCDVILFFVDGRQGMTADDQAVADLLRRTAKPVLLVVNKMDHAGLRDQVYDFYALGLGDPIPISSANMLGLGDLLDEVLKLLPPDEETPEGEDAPIRIAVLGRPNVGKSSLVNRLLGQNRALVSDIPGTTRDAIDTALADAQGRYVLIDTAGMRRKRTIEDESIERYAIVRTLAAIHRCDVALILVDAQDGVTEQDTKIAGLACDEGKAAMIVVNKWDLPHKETGTLEAYEKQVRESFKFMAYAPILFISALDGQRVAKVLPTARTVFSQASKRITTGALNDVLGDAVAALQPPASGGRRLKIYYGTQQAVRPPTFILFINDEKLMHFAYERYLENQFRKAFGFEGTPLRIVLRERKKEA